MAVMYHILAILSFALSTSAFDCIKTINKTVSEDQYLEGTYDLCDFVVDEKTKDGWYAAYDSRNVGNIERYGGDAVNFTFYFNIASNVAKPPPDPECINYNETWRQNHDLSTGYCKDIASNGTCPNGKKNIVPIVNITAAYQAKKGTTDTEKCWRLHDGVTEPIWTFLDPKDPAKGIQVTYVNGDWCPIFGKNREFKIQFKCANDIQITHGYVDRCSFVLIMETYRGCPTECPVNNDQLCSGHGVCDYDWQRGKPKCFCYLGWDGPDCRDVAQPMTTTSPINYPTQFPSNGEFGIRSTIDDGIDSQSHPLFRIKLEFLISSGVFVCCVLFNCAVFGCFQYKKNKQMQRELDQLRAQNNDVELPGTQTKPKRTQLTNKSQNKMKYEKFID
eukprot:336644_1